MEQGQLGRQPPGHEPRGTPRFFRDAVVFDDYAIHEGMVIPQGTIRVRYSPETCPALPQQLARLARGDTAAVLAFVRTYGLLGYAQVAAAVGRDTHSHAPGDPLAWIWAQAETVALCLLLTYGLQAGDDAALQHGLRALQLPQPPHADGGPRLIVPAVWDQPRVHVCWPSPLHSPEDWRTYARHIRREVLNAHLQGDPPPVRGAWEHGSPGLPVSGPHCHGLLASPPGRHARGRPTVCRGLVSGVLCPDAAHAAVLSGGEACARQPVCGPRSEPEVGRAATRVVLVKTGSLAMTAAQPVARNGWQCVAAAQRAQTLGSCRSTPVISTRSRTCWLRRIPSVPS